VVVGGVGQARTYYYEYSTLGGNNNNNGDVNTAALHLSAGAARVKRD